MKHGDEHSVVQEIEEDFRMERKRQFAAVFNALGGVSGMISIFLIVFYGGQMKRQIDINTVAIRDLQITGSVSLQTHVAADAKESVITADRISNISRLVEKLVEHNTELVQQVRQLTDIIKFQNNVKDPKP